MNKNHCIDSCINRRLWEPAVQRGELESVLCGCPDVWDGGWEGGPVVRDRASLVAQRVRNLPAMWETQV